MGNPISQILFYFFFAIFWKKILNFLNYKYWLRYVGDSLAVSSKYFWYFHYSSDFNSVRSYIQFTFELENPNNFPLFDLWVTTCNYFFQTGVFRKPSSIYIAPSNHRVNQEIGTFYIYEYDALKICADCFSLTSKLNYLRGVVVKRGFSAFVVGKAL